MLTVVSDSADRDGSGAARSAASSVIDEIVREGARRMLAEALQAEVDAYIAQFADERDENGSSAGGAQRLPRAADGDHQRRRGGGHAPRVNDKRVDPDTGERQRFSSAILPPWARKTPKIGEVLPLLYLHGLSSGDFVPALGQFLGSAKGLSASTITKLTETWKAEQQRVRRAGPVGRGLRVPVGRRHPRQRAPGRGQAVPAGDDRGARRRPQGAGRADRRLPRGHRVVGRSAARLPPPRHARPGAGRSATARWDSGARCARCSRRPASSVAGSTRSRMFLPRCRSRRTRGRRRRSQRSGTPRTSPTPATR